MDFKSIIRPRGSLWNHFFGDFLYLNSIVIINFILNLIITFLYKEEIIFITTKYIILLSSKNRSHFIFTDYIQILTFEIKFCMLLSI